MSFPVLRVPIRLRVGSKHLVGSLSCAFEKIADRQCESYFPKMMLHVSKRRMNGRERNISKSRKVNIAVNGGNLLNFCMAAINETYFWIKRANNFLGDLLPFG